MRLTERDKKILDSIVSIGRRNTSMKEIADALGISYSYLMKRRTAMAHNNGYATPLGLMIDYAKTLKDNPEDIGDSSPL